MKAVESLYSPGRPRNHMEDGHFIKLPFFGVIDGYSAPYNSCDEEKTLVLFDGLSGGEMVRDTISTAFFSACSDLPLECVATDANKEIARTQALKGVSLSDAGCLAGASAVLGKICQDKITLIQVGDCYAIWLYESGEIGITENKVFQFDLKARKNFSRLLKIHNSDRLKTWRDHCSFLADLRKNHANIDYPILNGQMLFEEHWQKTEIPLKGLKLLILLTDGFINIERMADKRRLAKDILKLFQSEQSLNGILGAARAAEIMAGQDTHEKHTEATGMAISFE